MNKIKEILHNINTQDFLIGILISIMSLYLMIFITILLIYFIPHAFDGSNYHYPKYNKIDLDGTPNVFRNFLEIIYFISQIFVPLVGFLALRAISFAKKQSDHALAQAQEAENTRIVSVFLEIEAQWSSVEMKKSRAAMTDIYKKYEKIYGPKQDLGDYFHAIISEIRENDTKKYMTLMNPMYYFETIGLMEKRKYVTFNDIKELIGGSILTYHKCFFKHLKTRSENESPTLFIETRNLMAKMIEAED